MCLYTKNKDPFKTDKPIEVYKILLKHKGKWVAPYQMFGDVSYVYKRGLNYPKGSCLPIRSFCGWRVGDGCLHSFLTNQEAIINIVSLKMYHPKLKFRIFKMYIPKDSYIYINEGGTCICSDKLLWKYFNHVPVFKYKRS